MKHILLLVISLLLSSTALAGAGMNLTGHILSFDDKTLVLLAEDQRWELDRNGISLGETTENCNRSFDVSTTAVMKVKPLKQKITVVCTNRAKRS